MSEHLIERLANHDSNEERRYLREGRRLNVTWSWLWLNWGFGPNVSFDPYGDEKWSAWICVGPLCVEAYWRAER